MIRSKWINATNRTPRQFAGLQTLLAISCTKKKTTVLAIQKTTFTKAKVLVGNFERLTNLKNLKHVFKHVIIVTLEDRSYVEISRNQSQIGK